MPQAKANPICRATPVLTFAADYRSSYRVKRTLFLLTTGLLFAACTFAAKPPNVVLIISDDQSWTDYGFMEHEAIETPNIDRLARQSRLFKRGYVPTSLCCPSLATLITGLYPHQNGITGNEPPIPSGGKNADQYGSQVQECVASSTPCRRCQCSWPSAATSAISPANGGRATTREAASPTA